MQQYIHTDRDGNKLYYKDKAMTILHHEDGPAIEWAGGDKSWYINNKLHREGRPAIEWAGGDKAWYINGVFIFTVNRDGKLIERME